MTMGAFTSPRRTRSLNSTPARSRSPSPSQQMRAGRPWNRTRAGASSSHRCNNGSSGKAAATAASVTAMSAGSPDNATHRNGPLPSQNSGRR